MVVRRLKEYLREGHGPVMERLVIHGGHPLFGTVKISGSKKSVLALVSAALLANKPCIIENAPKVWDINRYLTFLRRLGVRSQYQGESTLIVDPTRILNRKISLKLDGFPSSSLYLFGALLGRYQQFSIEKPSFSIDPFLKGFDALGVKVKQLDQYLYFTAPKLSGNMIYLDSSDPALAINLMLAAIRAKGTTVLKNAPKDPELVDLAMFLSAMGAKIRGAGTDTIRIEGTHYLGGCRHTAIPDRMEAGIYMILAAATHGRIQVDQIIPHHLKSVSAKLREMGVEISEGAETIIVSGAKNDHYSSIDIKALPYPGFPIDLEQPFLTLLTQAKGTSLVTGHLSSNHFPLVDLLKKMGANIKIVGQSIMIQGATQLIGQEIFIHEPSSAAALLVAALISSNQTTLIGYEALEKNYDQMLGKVMKLGAAIQTE